MAHVRWIAILVVLTVACRQETVPQTASNAPTATATAAVTTEEEGDPPPTGKPTIMPDVEGKEVVAAIRELQAAGLYVHLSVAISGDQPQGVALKTDDHPGDTMHEGEYVILMVSLPKPVDVELSEQDQVKLSDAAAAKIRKTIAAAMGGQT